jgi:hypothetical protein
LIVTDVFAVAAPSAAVKFMVADWFAGFEQVQRNWVEFILVVPLPAQVVGPGS